MANKAFYFSLTLKELAFVLFRKKQCPKCNSKLTRKTDKKTVNGADIATASTPLYIQGRQVEQYSYQYNCPACKTTYTLTDHMNTSNRQAACEPDGFIAYTAENGVEITHHYAEDIFAQEERVE